MYPLQNEGDQLPLLWGTFGPNWNSISLVYLKIDVLNTDRRVKYRPDR